ncbi:MAG: hypothetical protein V4550_05165 [Gemmatimonadota bacterium]
MSEITDDDAVLAAALRTRDCDVVAAPWDADVAWESFDAVVLRSCWDYHHRADEFRCWIADCVAKGVNLWNPAVVVEWNLHKAYLRDAWRAGVRVPATRWIGVGADVRLATILEEKRIGRKRW